MFGNLSGWHLIVILFIILLLFGAPKLPGLAKSLGQSMKILKKEVGSDKATDGEDTVSAADAAPAAPLAAAAPAAESVADELARAKAEAAAAKAEAESLRAAAERRKTEEAAGAGDAA